MNAVSCILEGIDRVLQWEQLYSDEKDLENGGMN